MSDVRVGPADDADRYLSTDLLVWFDEPPTEPTERVLDGIPEDGRFAAHVDDADERWYAGVYPLTLTVPGPRKSLRQLPVAGLTWVGVHPDERRRGVLTAMLHDHFERTRDGDWSGLSVLHASEPAIYGRHGYGIASWETRLTLSRGATLTAPGLDEAASAIRTRLTNASDEGIGERLRQVALRVGATHLGAVVRERALYDQFARDNAQSIRDREPQRFLFAQLDGEDVGYAWFRRTPKWDDDQPQGTVAVIEMVGTPAAELALLRRLVDLDLTTSVKVRGRSVDDRIVAWVGSPRTVLGGVTDSLWVRLVDLPKALTARGYAAACDVVLDVDDARAPWNSGRWRLTVDDDGAATVERTDADADVRLSTQTLASAYLGARSLVAQRDSGLLTELRAGATDELDAALRTLVAPVGAVGF
ncbi:GNAT family N-acetyltransferase [Luteipulveratus halotolerans]|uniref:GNAT family N-acetyltransferase n=1 Tax=Luteipulveratus halotolerans TaxID=1631356 RepID=UPI000682BFE2|nr:GNAT family N-acetyltransferase [Luteipulveratus halotolerans]